MAKKKETVVEKEAEALEEVVEASEDGTEPQATETAEAEMSEVALTLEEQLAQAQQEAGQNLENWQRTAAEFANFKRRQEEQRKILRDRIKAEVLEGVPNSGPQRHCDNLKALGIPVEIKRLDQDYLNKFFDEIDYPKNYPDYSIQV